MFSIKFHFLIRKIRTTCTLIPTIIIDYDKEYRPCKVLRVFSGWLFWSLVIAIGWYTE